MMRYLIPALFLLSTAALADSSALKFDTAGFCAWQNQHNQMAVADCTKVEDESKAQLAALEAKADPQRKDDCTAAAKAASEEAGLASYTVYTSCLIDGPGAE
jgi:hypothetical protein